MQKNPKQTNQVTIILSLNNWYTPCKYSVIWKFTYLISNKHLIAPVKINIIFILIQMYRKTSQFATCIIRRKLFYQTQKFILNKKWTYRKICLSLTGRDGSKYCYQFSLSLSLSLSLSRSIDRSIDRSSDQLYTHFCEIFGKQYYMSMRGSRNLSKGAVEENFFF